MVTIVSLIETARANNADPYYYLKYLMDQMPKHLYDNGNEYMADLMPWSDAYRKYESIEYGNMVRAKAPPGNEKTLNANKGKILSAGRMMPMTTNVWPL